MHKPNETPSLKTGFEVLSCLIESGTSLGVSQIADRLKLSKATVYRLLRAFTRLGYIEQQEISRKYTISPEIFGFLHHLTSHFRPCQNAALFIRDAAAKRQCSIYISMLAGRRSYVVAASGRFGDTTVLGTSGPAFATSCGKVLVAAQPPELWFDYAPRITDKAITKHTNLDAEKFIAELKSAAATGVAWNRAESSIYYSVAASITEAGRPVRLAVAMLYPYANWALKSLSELEEEIKILANDISNHISPVSRHTPD